MIIEIFARRKNPVFLVQTRNDNVKNAINWTGNVGDNPSVEGHRGVGHSHYRKVGVRIANLVTNVETADSVRAGEEGRHFRGSFRGTPNYIQWRKAIFLSQVISTTYVEVDTLEICTSSFMSIQIILSYYTTYTCEASAFPKKCRVKYLLRNGGWYL